MRAEALTLFYKEELGSPPHPFDSCGIGGGGDDDGDGDGGGGGEGGVVVGAGVLVVVDGHWCSQLSKFLLFLAISPASATAFRDDAEEQIRTSLMQFRTLAHQASLAPIDTSLVQDLVR